MPSASPASTELLAELRSGRRPLDEYLREIEGRFARLEPRVLAFMPEEHRFERLQEEARQLTYDHLDPGSATAALRRCSSASRTSSAPTASKPAAAAGCRRRSWRAPEAEIVTRLKRLGALVAGKTVSTEFAYFAPGTDPQPTCSRAHARRLIERLGGRGRRRSLPAGPRHADDRLGQPAGGFLWRRRLQADLRHGFGQRADPAVAVPRPCRLVRARRRSRCGCGDRRAAAAGLDAGPRAAADPSWRCRRVPYLDRASEVGRRHLERICGRLAGRGLRDRRGGCPDRHRGHRGPPSADRLRRGGRGAQGVVRAATRSSTRHGRASSSSRDGE